MKAKKKKQSKKKKATTKPSKKKAVKLPAKKKSVKKKTKKKNSTGNPPAKDPAPKKTKPFKKKDGRIDWVRNNNYLVEVYLKFYEDNKGKHPTIVQLCEETGFARQTVVDHLKDFSFEKMKKGSKSKILLPKIIDRLAMRCATGAGNDRDVKLLFQIIADWSEKSTVENVNRYDYRALKEKFDPADDLEAQVKKINEFLIGQN